MEAYRDQYATIFNSGRHVTLIGVSVDPDTTLHAWAREKEFPFLLGHDAGGAMGRRYGAWDAKNQLDDRSLFVIGPDGRIAYKAQPFKALSGKAYTDLGAVLDSLAPTPPDSTMGAH